MMNISPPHENDTPLTRQDVLALLGGKNSERLDLSGKNLRGADLSNLQLSKTSLRGAVLIKANLSKVNLQKVDLRGAVLTEANLQKANLSRANLSGAILTRANLTDTLLGGANLNGVILSESNLTRTYLIGSSINMAVLGKTDTSKALLTETDLTEFLANNPPSFPEVGDGHPSIAYFLKWSETDSSLPANDSDQKLLQIRFNEELLTTHNFTTTLTAIKTLHTKTYLLAVKRYEDLISYTQTGDSKFDVESNLVITRLQMNSPGEVDLKSDPAVKLNIDITPEGLAKGITEVLTNGIDGILHAGVRKEAAKAAIDAVRAEIAIKERESIAKVETVRAETNLKEKKTESELATEELRRQLEAQRVELETQKAQLEIEKERLALETARLEYEKNRVNTVLEIAKTMVRELYPSADPETQAMFARTLLPQLLTIGNSKGLELLSLPTPQNNPTEQKTEAGEAVNRNDVQINRRIQPEELY